MSPLSRPHREKNRGGRKNQEKNDCQNEPGAQSVKITQTETSEAKAKKTQVIQRQSAGQVEGGSGKRSGISRFKETQCQMWKARERGQDHSPIPRLTKLVRRSKPSIGG